MKYYARYCQRVKSGHKKPVAYTWQPSDEKYGHMCPSCRETMLALEELTNAKTNQD